MFVKSNRCCVMSHERGSPAYYSDLLPASSISRHSAKCPRVVTSTSLAEILLLCKSWRYFVPRPIASHQILVNFT